MCNRSMIRDIFFLYNIKHYFILLISWFKVSNSESALHFSESFYLMFKVSKVSYIIKVILNYRESKSLSIKELVIFL